MFNPTANDLFDQDHLLQGAPEGAYRVTHSIIALIVRVGEGALATERAVGKVLHGKAHTVGSTHPNSPYGTRSKAASSSTPNLSTLQHSVSLTPKAAKRWSPPSPSLPTVRSNSPADDSPTTTTAGGEWTSAREVRDLSASGSSGKTAKASAVPSPEKPPPLPPKKDKVPFLPSSLPNESALVTDSEDDSDTNDTFHDAETIPDKAHAPIPPSPLSPRRTRVSGPNSSLNANVTNPARPPHEPVRASVASGTTQTTATTAQSSLVATGLGGGDRTSANFGTFRTATTVATSVAASELYRGDSSSMAPSASESSCWDNESSAGSQYHPYGKLASNMRDRKPSEVGNYDLTRVAEEVEEGTLNTGRDNSSELKRRIPVVSLGQGKWPDDFVDAFKPPTPSRAININRRDLEKPIRSSPPHSVSPRKFAYIGESPPSGSVESLSHLGPRRPVHRPRHSLDAPVLPKEAVYGGGRADSAQQFHKQTWIVAFFN